jgi:hypothetical protein
MALGQTRSVPPDVQRATPIQILSLCAADPTILDERSQTRKHYGPLQHFSAYQTGGVTSPFHKQPLHSPLPRYLGVSSRLTASLTCLPSTRTPAAENRAMTFFITVPISFIVGDPISVMTAFTPPTMSSSPAALGM